MKPLRATLTALGLITVGVFVLYWHVAAKLASDWVHDGNYSHGFLIIPLASLAGGASVAMSVRRPGVQ